MNIDILCSDEAHPINRWFELFKQEIGLGHSVRVIRRSVECDPGDLLFLIGCTEFVKFHFRSLYRYSVVCHASDLPSGRGWSPYIWDILGGKNDIVMSLINAEDKIDSGAVWRKTTIHFEGTELSNEINSIICASQIEMMHWMVENCDLSKPSPQAGEISYWPKRTIENSRLDPDKTIREQFNLLRVCDSERFPAFFEINNNRYYISLFRRNSIEERSEE